ncbi:hypothetical protein Kpol_1070p19 [Vanderwaltozyma polyspora DSM 70294]|uniref:BAR domain-containing protein n=1 Tax=Vanderwaltozyma polyspora (strain ATCC 22028 / DSM 70294 / BCRC 21397 / CBS 2163 / NBRC 10782 / NRRL Y-8283 / UCD 57-17) TaxID=436907 RepID=A7TNL9_VANPO|nr:uncharacterized protein Kpol_1070p19 [Vanderwaltozyma polyspora DSM 70294]EDO16136.1 hypothetical protein Kpol_1070p19 [Vanderwaltozyma polyspora DSM 70294]
MSFNSFTNSLSQKFQELSTAVSEKTQEFSTSIPTLAESTQRLVQEKLGNVTDISQLPQEYIELERQVDTIKLVYEHFLQITAIYENESYDYPKYVSDSVNDFSKVFANKVTELSHATSAQEAQNILVTPGPAKEPRTLNYALSKVALNSSESLAQLADPNEGPVADALLKFSDVQAKIAQTRLHQDTLIQTKFNKQLREKLELDIGKASKARKDVQYKRLQYDVARSKLTQAKPEKEASLRVEMESLEEQFAQSTEDATIIMQEVIADSKFLSSLKELAEAQLSYFETSAQLLKEFMPVLDSESSATTNTK